MTLFSIKNIEIEMVERIDSISTYNDNYFKIESYLDECYDFYGNDVIRIKSYDDEDDEYEKSAYIGKLVNGKFVPAFMVTYDEGWDI